MIGTLDLAGTVRNALNVTFAQDAWLAAWIAGDDWPTLVHAWNRRPQSS